MIHLDANLLIAIVNPCDLHHASARFVLAKSQSFSASALAWMEAHSRPMDSVHTQALRHILTGGILPFDEATAALAGSLFFQTGSKRRTRMDTMIAASAILVGAELATANPADFTIFVPLGLKLLSMDRL